MLRLTMIFKVLMNKINFLVITVIIFMMSVVILFVIIVITLTMGVVILFVITVIVFFVVRFKTAFAMAFFNVVFFIGIVIVFFLFPRATAAIFSPTPEASHYISSLNLTFIAYACLLLTANIFAQLGTPPVYLRSEIA